MKIYSTQPNRWSPTYIQSFTSFFNFFDPAHIDMQRGSTKISKLDERYTKLEFRTSEGIMAAFFTLEYFQNTLKQF